MKRSSRVRITIKALASPAPPPLVTFADAEVSYGNSTRLRVASPDSLLNYR